MLAAAHKVPGTAYADSTSRPFHGAGTRAAADSEHRGADSSAASRGEGGSRRRRQGIRTGCG